MANFLISLKQGTPEWLEWRKTGIGASPVNTIIGCDQHKTRYILWGELCGFWAEGDLSKNPHVIRGNRFEDEARTKFEQKTGRRFPPICVESDAGAPYICSLDGYDQFERELLEIKVPCPSIWDDIESRKQMSKAYRTYYTQVQYQLLVTGIQVGYLAFYNIETEELLSFRIQACTVYQDWLAEQVMEFFILRRDRLPPALDLDRDVITPSVAQNVDINLWRESAYDLIQRLEEKKQLDEQLDRLKSEIKETQIAFVDLLGGFKRGEIDGVKLSMSEISGKVDYRGAYEALVGVTGEAMDLDEYRGKDSVRYRISIDKQSAKIITNEHLKQVKKRIFLKRLISQSDNEPYSEVCNLF